MTQYIRHAVAPIEVVAAAIKAGWNDKKPTMTFEGYQFNVSSLRLRTMCRDFYAGRFRCVGCGLVPTFFSVDSFAHGNQNFYHVNLFGVKNGQDILFTHDHILARALGGRDELNNTQLMCAPCNSRKGKAEQKILEQQRAQKC